MPKLTEDMVIARTKTSDLGTIKKFNCWGSELSDISIIRRFRNVEVLSLSLNNISSLSDFQFCQNLVELYIRRNSINDLSEVAYLADLPRLTRLLLSENPCVETAGTLYRATVLRCLPNLEILDGVQVTPEEVETAQRNGLILEHPLVRRATPDSGSYYTGDGSPPPPGIVLQQQQQRVVRGNSVEYDYEDEQTEYRPVVIPSQPVLHQPAPPTQPEYFQNGRVSPSQTQQQPLVQRSPVEPVPVQAPQLNTAPLANVKVTSTKIHMTQTQPATTTNGYAIAINNNNNNYGNGTGNKSPTAAEYTFTNGTGPVDNNSLQRRITPEHQYQLPQQMQMNGRRQSMEYTEQYFDTDTVATSRIPLQTRNAITIAGPVRAAPKVRPRQSNVLSAVLCLIPELDWQSLEVIELAIRRRMDELNSD